ncbi:MAG: hypothetical protein WKG01_25310 [Kofleriaceae bacterium]
MQARLDGLPAIALPLSRDLGWEVVQVEDAVAGHRTDNARVYRDLFVRRGDAIPTPSKRLRELAVGLDLKISITWPTIYFEPVLDPTALATARAFEMALGAGGTHDGCLALARLTVEKPPGARCCDAGQLARAVTSSTRHAGCATAVNALDAAVASTVTAEREIHASRLEIARRIVRIEVCVVERDARPEVALTAAMRRRAPHKASPIEAARQSSHDARTKLHSSDDVTGIPRCTRQLRSPRAEDARDGSLELARVAEHDGIDCAYGMKQLVGEWGGAGGHRCCDKRWGRGRGGVLSGHHDQPPDEGNRADDQEVDSEHRDCDGTADQDSDRRITAGAATTSR